MSNNLYNEDSIQKLDPLSFTRLRPDTYLGSNEDSTQLAREIISNCSDEFLAGHCTTVVITYDEKTNVFTATDDGQGIIPNVIKEDGQTILQMVYGDINSSGKYDKSDNAVYKVSTGAFGIGASLSNFLSHWLTATTKRNGQSETVYFEEGIFKKREQGKCSPQEHGVTVSLNPSEEFFRDAHINVPKLKKELFNLACVCKGLKFIFNGEEIYHPQGIIDLLEEEIKKDVSLLNNNFSFYSEKERQSLDFCLTFTSKSSNTIIPFCNYGLIESGTPVTTVKSTITRTLNKWGKEQGVLKENLTGNALQEGMIVVFNLSSPNVRYDSQTKVRATHTEDNSFISSTLGEQLEIWLDNNPDDGKNIIEKALVARKAAEAAKKARERVKAKVATPVKAKAIQLPTTLTDCWSKDRSKCELFVCEGKSAAAGLVAGRDSETQAIYGVRGKMLSVLKTAVSNIYKNQEINNLVQALGLDVDEKTCKLVYDEKKLRYGKIIAAADADFDGFAIENLLFNILWYMCPELITNGHVYSAVPPLFRVTTKKNEYVYLRDAEALAAYQKEYGAEVQSIGRLKGLGEQDSDELSYCLLDPETRNVLQLKVEDYGKTDKMFQDLYGKRVEPRVQFLAQHLEEARVD